MRCTFWVGFPIIVWCGLVWYAGAAVRIVPVKATITGTASRHLCQRPAAPTVETRPTAIDRLLIVPYDATHYVSHDVHLWTILDLVRRPASSFPATAPRCV